MKSLFILIACFLMIAFFSCKKKETKNTSTGNAIGHAVDSKILGNYTCMQINYNMVMDSLGHIVQQIDTGSSIVMVNVSSITNSYMISLTGTGTYLPYSFITSSSYGNVYSASCPNGPCSSITFNADSSITVFRKIANPFTICYVGKK